MVSGPNKAILSSTLPFLPFEIYIYFLERDDENRVTATC
jgi:hypothetical protein